MKHQALKLFLEYQCTKIVKKANKYTITNVKKIDIYLEKKSNSEKEDQHPQ